jgi:hypothetical protein
MHWFRETLFKIIDQGGGASHQGTASVNAVLVAYICVGPRRLLVRNDCFPYI